MKASEQYVFTENAEYLTTHTTMFISDHIFASFLCRVMQG